MDIPMTFGESFISGEEEIIQSFLLDCTKDRGVGYTPRLYGYDNPSEAQEALYRIADTYNIRIISYNNDSIEFELNGKSYKRKIIK